MKLDELINDIRVGKIDINNQELFFSTLIKGLLIELNKEIFIRNIPVAHYILHTGSDALYLERKGQDISVEPYSISNEKYVHVTIPNCIVKPGGITVDPNQLTNPYSTGHLQYEDDESVYELVGEVRRMPIKLAVDITYQTDSYRDLMELVQQLLTKLAFIRTYKITYMGQMIQCSYKIPESFDNEYLMEISGDTQDSTVRKTQLSLEIESNLPIYSPATIISADNYVSTKNWKLINSSILHETN